MDQKNKKKMYKDMQAGMDPIHYISTMYLSAGVSLDVQQKATSANIIYKRTTRLFSLLKERWLHYMYRIIEINIMYNIYTFRLKIIQLQHH